MSFHDHAKLLFTLLQAKAMQDFLKKKNILLSVDKTNKNFILHSQVFSENGYVSLKVREFVLEKNFSSEWKTYLKICDKTSTIHLQREVPFQHERIHWRKIFIDFFQHAESTLSELQKIAEKDSLFLSK